MFKKAVIPYKENIYRPDFAAVICFFIRILSVSVIFQHLHKQIGIKEFFRHRRCKHRSHTIIIFFLFQPNPNRDRKTKFLFLCRLGKRAYSPKGIAQILAFGAVASAGVLFLTDNLSTAIIVAGITCILIFVSHPKTKPFLVIIGIGIAVAAVGIAILSVTVANSDNFRLQRVISWLNPEATADTGSFQVMQGLYAIGSGGLFGKGLGNSTQKLGVIPEAQNDMILVVICEELGVFGAVVILVLFALLLYRLIFIAKNAPDLFGSLIATGIFAHIALQVILNIAVVTGLLPTTGITLPFISYGGTAIVFLMAEMGIALGISRKIRLE